MQTLSEILEFDFEIDNLQGARNYLQDTLSRRPDYKEPPLPTDRLAGPLANFESIFPVELAHKNPLFDRIRTGYGKDPYLKDVVQFLTKGNLITMPAQY
jgi:hypothetical protein